MDYLTYYLTSDDPELLLRLAVGQSNFVGPLRGSAAIEAATDVDGNIIPAQAARGNPDLWYATIRTEEPITLLDGVAEISEAEVSAVVGVWA